MIKRLMTIICLTGVLLLPSLSEAAQKWLADVQISCADDSQRLILGASDTTTDGYDIGADTGASLIGYLMAYFDHAEWGRNVLYYWTDVRDLQVPKEWVFYVASSYINRQITINWSLSDVPPDLNLYLIDDAGNSMDMKAQATYVYTNTATVAKMFRVRAEGTIGDTTPPETTITTAISEFTGSSVIIAYSGTDNTTAVGNLQFAYKLDSGSWSAWSFASSATLNGLSDGAHTFSVKAKDEAGNEDQSPAEVRFTVATTPSVLTLNQPNPSALWPVDGKMTNVIISGNVKSGSAGLASITYAVSDEYNELNSSGAVTPAANGDFSFTLSLKAERDGKDQDGRIYIITINAVDKAGAIATKSVAVTVPHDMR